MKAVSAFNSTHASVYDDQWKKLSPTMDGLHFLMSIILKDLPQDARILCVGVGTGAELMALAKIFPEWKFTAVEPAGAMLDICRQKVEEAGFTSRCTFHEGYLNTLPSMENFDAATAILVSQFMFQENDRINFFKEIYSRLKSSGILVSADLASPVTDILYESLKGAWTSALLFAGFSDERAAQATAAWKVQVAVSKPSEVESIISKSGFMNPTLFYQTLFIHSWFSRVP